MKHFTEQEIQKILHSVPYARPAQWYFEREFWEKHTKQGLLPDTSNPHYSELNRCWGWNGTVLGGYGVIQKMNQTKGAHRVSYEIHYGPIPEKMIVMHKCDNKICTNPEHLELGTTRQNIQAAHHRGLVKAGKKKSCSAKPDQWPYLIIGSVINSLNDRVCDILEGEVKSRYENMWAFQKEIKLLLRDCYAMAHPYYDCLQPKKAKKKISKIQLERSELLEDWIQEIYDNS